MVSMAVPHIDSKPAICSSEPAAQGAQPILDLGQDATVRDLVNLLEHDVSPRHLDSFRGWTGVSMANVYILSTLVVRKSASGVWKRMFGDDRFTGWQAMYIWCMKMR